MIAFEDCSWSEWDLLSYAENSLVAFFSGKETLCYNAADKRK